jgi:hypothetical protein
MMISSPVEAIDSDKVIPTHSYGHPSSLSQAIIWKEKQLDKNKKIHASSYSKYLHPHNFASDKNSTTSHLQPLLLRRHHHRHPYRGLQEEEDDFDVKDVTSDE